MIKTSELKAKIEKRIEERKAQQANRITIYEEKLSKSRVTWWATQGGLWEQAVKRMTDALEAGEPITVDLIPGGRYANAETWAEPSGRPADTYEVPQAVEMLLAAIEVHGQDEITSTEFARLGISAEHMRTVTKFLSKAWY